MHIETEIKLRIAGPDEGRALLASRHYIVLHPRVFEANSVYDTPDHAFGQRRELIRVRRVGERNVLTFKSAEVPGPHKSREELETTIADAAVFETILGRLGLQLVFRYEKYRTEYQRENEPGIITLDETPIGTFFELEGAPDWIDATARLLGFSTSDYILVSYGGLYLEYSRQRNLPPTNMTFHR